MKKTNIENTIFYLIDILKLSSLIKKEIKPMINYLIQLDFEERNPFEFSLRIQKGKIKKSLRFVSYDNCNCSFFSQNLYKKRIKLIEKILFLYFKPASIKQATKLLRIFKNLVNYRLPIFIGFERNNTDLKLKLYLNFFNYLDSTLPIEILQSVLNQFKIKKFKIKKRKFPMIGFDISNNKKLNYKIYYLYKNSENLRPINFSNYKKTTFNFLKKYNKNPYFVVSERYSNGDFISKKIEVGIREDLNNAILIKNLLRLDGSDRLCNKIQEILNRTNSKLNTVIIENNFLTLYFRLKNEI